VSVDYELPDDWKLVTTGDIAEVVGGGTPKTTIPGNFTDEGGHPWLTPADLTGYTDKYIARGKRNLTDQGLATSSAKYMPAGTVLYSTRAPIGYVAIAANRVTTNQGFRSFVPSPEVDPEYLYYALKLARHEAEQLASGTTFAELSGTNAKKLHLPLAPLDTQRLIVKLLDVANASNASARQHLITARRAIEQFRQAVLAAACSGRLTADWREKRLNVDIDGDLPTGWRNVELQELAADGVPIRYGIVKPGPEVAGGIPYIRQQDVIDGAVLVHQLAHTSPEIADRYRGSALQEGDVLLGIIRNLRVAIVPPGLDGANITQGMVRIRPRPGVEGGYLALYLGSPAAQRWMHDRYVGLAMPRINVQDARVIPVPLPPKGEQTEIVARATEILSVADEVATRVGLAASNIDRTTQAVLAKAFRGELVGPGGSS